MRRSGGAFICPVCGGVSAVGQRRRSLGVQFGVFCVRICASALFCGLHGGFEPAGVECADFSSHICGVVCDPDMDKASGAAFRVGVRVFAAAYSIGLCMAVVLGAVCLHAFAARRRLP